MPQRLGVESPQLVFPLPNVAYHDAEADDRAGLVRYHYVRAKMMVHEHEDGVMASSTGP